MSWTGRIRSVLETDDGNVEVAGRAVPTLSVNIQGLVTVPFWVYWTSPYSSLYIPNGWVMFNGDI